MMTFFLWIIGIIILILIIVALVLEKLMLFFSIVDDGGMEYKGNKDSYLKDIFIPYHYYWTLIKWKRDELIKESLPVEKRNCK